MSTLEMFLFFVVILALSPFVIRRMASSDICFTYGMTNHIKFVDRGGTRTENKWEGGVFDHMIPEVPGYILDDVRSETSRFRLPNGEEKQKMSALNLVLRRLLGVYWYGLYPFKHIRSFPIKKQYENIEGTGPENWIRQGDTVNVKALRFRFPRPFIFTDIELSDRFTVSLKVVTTLQVMVPYVAVYVYDGDFFTQTGSLLQGAVIDAVKNENINSFVQADKGEIGGMLDDLKTDTGFNRRLEELVGLDLSSVSINDYKPGDEEIVKAIRQTALATEKGNAAIEAAKKYAEEVGIQAEADGSAKERLAKATRAEVDSIVEPLKAAPEVSREAAEVLQARFYAGPDSKLTNLTLVKGAAQPVIPVGDTK